MIGLTHTQEMENGMNLELQKLCTNEHIKKLRATSSLIKGWNFKFNILK